MPEKVDVVVARIDERTQAMNDRLKSFLDRLVLVESVATKASADASKIMAVETKLDIVMARITFLETYQAKKEAQGTTLKIIWGILNNPIVIVILGGLLWVYGRMMGWKI
jgi:hypothetical protein